MFLSTFSINRPVFSISLNLLIVIIGILSLLNLHLQQYPTVEEPIITIRTEYYGASPFLVESKITIPLENALHSINNLDYLESRSTNGTSEIILFFKEGKSLVEASSEVRENISKVRSLLPSECKEPAILKYETNQKEFLYLVLTSTKHNELELYDYAARLVKDRIETISGIANAKVHGNPYTMQIHIDRGKLKKYNITTTDVLEAIKSSSHELPAGRITKGMRYVNVVTATNLNSPKEMEQIIIKVIEGKIIQLKDVANIFLDKDSFNASVSRFNGTNAVFIALSQIPGSNILDISYQVKNLISEIQESLPSGIKLSISFDFSNFISAALNNVYYSIFEAIVLVLLVTFLFLRSMRATIIPLVTIPISIIGSFIFLYFFDCSINTITLFAIVLAVGLVVDDAIVILENIQRHIEQGLTPLDAAFKGSKEIGFAIIAMTLTLASAYIPIAFTRDFVGKLFSEFAITLTGAVIISGIVALTLSPMMCSRILLSRAGYSKKRKTNVNKELFAKIEKYYQKIINYIMRSPRIVIITFLSVFISIYLFFYLLPQELSPLEDQGIIFSCTLGSEGASLQSLLDYTEKAEECIKKLPENNGMWSITTDGSGIFMGTTLVPWHERQRNQDTIISDLRMQLNSLAGMKSDVFPMGTLLGGEQGNIQFIIKTKSGYEELEQVMDNLVIQLKKIPGFESVSHDLLLSNPYIKVNINHIKSALMGVTVDDISRTLETMLSGSRPSTFEMEGQFYDIIVRAPLIHQQNLDDIGKFYVKSRASDQQPMLIPITQFISVEELAAPSGGINHFNKMRSARLNIALAPGYKLSDAINIIKQKTASILTPQMHLDYAGSLRKFYKSNQTMYIIFIAALFFTYFILAIQFESFLDPFLILITVPFSLAGALLTLYLSGCTLNVYSQIGLITLIGLVSKHGILIVEFANKLKKEGKSAKEAVIYSTTLRLRPIIMTTSTMVLGALPLAFATGAGAESLHQMGWTLIGGLFIGTVLTLFLLPFIYKKVKAED